MSKKRKYRSSGLISLYLNNIFQKPILIVFILSIILMSGFIVICANPWMDKTDYLKYSNDFHLMYFQQAILIIQIFNSVVVGALVISTVIQSNGFDVLFISYMPRRRICLVKIIDVAIILFILAFYELIVFMGVGIIIYPDFIPTLPAYIGFIYVYMVMMFEMVLSILLTTILQVVLVPMSLLFIFLVLKLLCNNYTNIRDVVSNIIPTIELDIMNLEYNMDNPILSVIWILLLILIYINIYSLKDIK